MRTNVYDEINNKLHVMPSKCSTCIFRPGNLMSLDDGRAEQMERDALAEDGVIPCHKTIFGDREQEAVCRGYWDRTYRKHALFQAADRLGIVVYDEGA